MCLNQEKMSTTAQPKPTGTTPPHLELFYPTTLKRRILHELADYECLTVCDLALHIYGNATKPRQFAVNRALWKLNDKVNRVEYGDAPNERGSKPYAYGLSERGVEYARDKCPDSDPVLFGKGHSTLTVGHEILRARTHYAIKQLCDGNQWEVAWKKSVNGRKPVFDDYFVVKSNLLPENENRLYFLLEKERRKKDFGQLLEKVQGYERIWNTEEARRRFGSPKFYIIFQFENKTRMDNFVEYLAGICNCQMRHGKVHHTCLSPENKKRPTEPIRRSKFWFTTDEQMFSNPGGDIFITPKDYQQLKHSFAGGFRQ
jgi:hypothetical protein